jgi:pyrroloquinoline quinone biosynthesis protein D
MAESWLDRSPRLSPFVRLQWEPVRGQHVLLRPEGVVYVNATGAAILHCCDGARSIASIAADLSTRYERVVAGEVAAFLDRLASKRLVEYDGVA